MAERSRLLTIGLPLAALVAGGYAGASILRTQPTPALVEPAIQPPLQPGAGAAALNSAGFIGSAGLIEAAGQEIDIGTPVSGVVTSVAAVAGQRLEPGAVLFTLDARTAEAQLALRKAELDVAERKLAQAEARIPSLKAALAAARATADAVRADLAEQRDQLANSLELKQKDSAALSVRELTRRQNAERAAVARLAEAEARIAQAEAELALVAGPGTAVTLDVERANVLQARRAVERAEADLAQLTVRAPIAGTVLQVNLRPGEFAQAGVLATPLMVIGQLDPLHVRVDVDEADIGRFSPGARAYASLRGQATRRAEMTFVRIEPFVVPKRALTGSTVERVDTRVLRVIYALPTGVLDAFAGQQVDVFIEATSAAPQVTEAGRPAQKR
jgi:HlyD family secretion protein